MAGFVIIPVLVMGIILGILELIFVHQDEAGMDWATHGFHTIPTMIVLLFISMNVDFFLGLVHWTPSNMWTIIIRCSIGLIALIKISATAAISRGRGLHEKLPHSFIIAALIVVAPFAWEMFLCNIGFIKSLPMSGCGLK